MTTKKPRVHTGLSSAVTANKRASHAHKHDHCKHEKLKFCAQCNRPHCLQCGTEWNSTYVMPFYLTGTNTTSANVSNVQASSANFGTAYNANGIAGTLTQKGHTH